jgi:hypothetical protein
MHPNYAFVPTTGTARHVSCYFRSGRGTTRRYACLSNREAVRTSTRNLQQQKQQTVKHHTIG